MKTRPEHFKSCHETLMSNFDGRVDTAVEEVIKGKDMYAAYTGWNFYGNVWWEDNQWHCEVWTYGSPQETVSAATLQEIMTEVCSIYGYE